MALRPPDRANLGNLLVFNLQEKVLLKISNSLKSVNKRLQIRKELKDHKMDAAF